MNKVLWITRKNYLCAMIKKISDGYGGDEIEWLRAHCREVLETFPNESIEEAIRCHEEIVKQIKYYTIQNNLCDKNNHS